MKSFDVLIQGISPLLQNRFTEQAEADNPTRANLIVKETPRDQAERVANRAPDGSFYMPGACILRLLREAGGGHKVRGTRKSVKYIVPAAVFVMSDTITLLNGDGRSKATDFEVDSRPVTIPATKGRIMRHRPRFEHWSLRFVLEVDPQVLPPEIVHQLLEEGGRRQGIGDYRPEKGGPFGRFAITQWKETK